MNSTMPKFGTAESTRDWPRYCSLRDLSLTYEGQSKSVAVRPPDLSPKGMFINTPVHFPESSVLKVSFRLARSNHPINTRCEVRYCVPGLGVGVEFIGIAPRDQKAISDEIRAMETRHSNRTRSRRRQEARGPTRKNALRGSLEARDKSGQAGWGTRKAKSGSLAHDVRSGRPSPVSGVRWTPRESENRT